MADYDYAGDAAPQGTYEPAEQGPSIGKMVNILGAVASLALVVGVGVWSYKLIVRDVSGIPVVRAAEGPMRERAKEPGGDPADHQGLAVNNVAAKGTAAPTADRVKLAPRPVSLTDEDMATTQVRPATRPKAIDPAPPNRAATEAFRAGSVDALVDQITEGVTPLSGEEGDLPEPTKVAAAIVQPKPLTPGEPAPQSEPAGQPETLQPAEAQEDPATEEAPKVIPAAFQPEPGVQDAPGMKRSLRPQPRPANLPRSQPAASGGTSASLNSAIAAAVETAAQLDVDPDSVPKGTRLAQLGAYDSPETAREEWDRLYARFGDYMDGKQRVIQKASSGGRTFYRLRAMGFDDIADARRFCSSFIAENADCIPVTTR